jgi:hypothetical protein
MSSRPDPSRTRIFAMIRASLTLGVLLLAAFAITQHRDQPVDPAIQYLPSVVAVFALGAVMFFRDRSARASGEQARSFALIAWAMGESAAIFGWVVHFIGAPLVWALPGTFAFVMAISLVPIPPE